MGVENFVNCIDDRLALDWIRNGGAVQKDP